MYLLNSALSLNLELLKLQTVRFDLLEDHYRAIRQTVIGRLLHSYSEVGPGWVASCQ